MLLAEDDPDNRGIVVKVLTREGYQTLEAADGRSALALARRELERARPSVPDRPLDQRRAG